jgi:predicted enzyme related to lactoylglutathione lyase
MPGMPFCWYELRTTDTDAAEAFYAYALGLQLRQADGASSANAGEQAVGLSRLPDRAAANGAPAHWLGHIATGDVETYVRRLVALGAQPLGPVQNAINGSAFAIMRDPFGAVLAVSSRTDRPARAAVEWHQLHTTDRDRAWATYAELFGWTPRDRLELGAELGSQQSFAWTPSGPPVGGISDTARAPHVHTHWLFCFGVSDLEAALAKIRAHGGDALTPVVLPSGDRVVACHDPQRAIFGLYASARTQT